MKMSQRIVIENEVFLIAADPQVLQEHALYQSVKKEIYRERSPFSGGTDWEQVKQNCRQIAQQQGSDFALSVYFTIACLKLDGLKGYANGLELVLCCLIQFTDTEHDKQIQRLLHWANAQALVELQNIKASYEVLRYLYRCEECCKRISCFLRQEHPDIKVDFESVGYLLFEHIDALEIRYQVALKHKTIDASSSQAHQDVAISPKRRWKYIGAFLLGGFVSVGVFYGLFVAH
jgi:type VI secretion system protein VasL